MNEVQVVCAQMLDGPEPPQCGVDEILTLARRARRRRRRFRTSSAVGAAAAIVLGILTATGAVPSGRTPSPQTAGFGDGSAPAARAPASHGERMAQVLRDAVPAGFAAVTETSFSDGSVVHPMTAPAAGSRSQLLAGTAVRVFAGPREGRLFAYLVYDGRAIPGGDLCAPELVPGPVSPGDCTVRVVAGVQIRVIVTTDAAHGQVVEATRFLAGGRLIVGAAQGPSPSPQASGGDSAPVLPLVAPPLDAAAVAALAADAAMLPPR